MKTLILGSGGREHAFAWKISQSPLCSKLYIAPGNAGTAACGENIHMQVNEFEKIGDFCIENQIDILIPGSEDPLVNGIVDHFKLHPQLQKIKVVGPEKQGAMLEGSKDFSKEFMIKYGVPTAAYKTFSQHDLADGLAYLETINPPYVLKADGLAAGKGVLIIDNLAEAKNELTEMISNAKFGKASSRVVVEEFLDGIEVSVFVLTDGKDYKILPAAKDYKRIGEGDTGLNTGGMGAVSPVPFVTDAFLKKVEERIVQPTIRGLAAENIDYKGFLFIGLMNIAGEPFVIEYNVRMGDPETEAVFPRIKTDLLQIMDAVATQTLGEIDLEITPQTAVTVVLVSGGYPGDYVKNKVITLAENSGANAIVFHSGTSTHEGQLVTNGGRVFALTALADTLPQALEKAMLQAEALQFEGKYFRRDIGQDLMKIMLQQ